MLKIQLPYKAISTNKLYLGAKVVSPEYKKFKRDVGLYLIANYPEPVDLKGNLTMDLEVGLSNSLADGSNTVKGIEDVLAEHFKFNDKQIVSIRINKFLVDKGSEYMLVSLRKTRKNIDRRTNGKTKA